MKLTLLLTLFTLANAAGSVYSQSQGLTLSVKNATVLEVFNKIEDQSKFKFFYQNEQIDLNRIVTVNVEGAKIEDILDQIFANENIKYRVLEDNLVLLTAEKKQQFKVTGIITSSKEGSPMPGVSVKEKDTNNGTISDANGKYSLTVQGPDAVLVFSFVSYLTEEKVVGNQSVINVALSEDIKQLDEVVVIGYGVQKRTSVTGAIASVSSKDLTQLSVASVQSAIQGKAAGVSVVNNGSPGTNPIVRIRGNGSISYSADPLYVVDGTPATDITSFDSRDIESLEVLKDASSTAIYGSRAANGVILITTKKGKKDGKVHVSLDSYMGNQSVVKMLDLLNTQQYIQYGTTLITNGTALGKTPALPPRFSHMNDPIYAGTTQTYAQTNTDWQKELFRNAVITDNNLSFSTGSEKSTFYASAGYFKQDGIMVGTGYTRGSFRFNSEHDISKRIKMGQTLLYSYGDRDNQKETQGRTNVMHAIRSLPYLPVTDPTMDGGYRGANSGADGSDPDNPVKIEKLFESTTGTSKLFGTIYLDIKLASFLTFRSTAGLDYTNILNSIHLPIYNDGFNANTTATVSRETFENITKTFTNQLTFDKTWGNHYLNVIAVQEETPYSSRTMFTTGRLTTNATKELTGLSNINANGSLQKNLLLSYLGRINYEFKSKYLLSVSMRADGSSKFAPGNKWGYFPSGSIGWRLNKEEFMKDLVFISDLKLRAGYGELGNNGVGNYDWQSVILANTDYVFNNTTAGGSFFNALANKDLKWETSKMTNVGLDLGLFNGRFTFSAEWFNKVTDNLILAVPYDKTIGYYAAAYTNIGKMKNYGMEFQAGIQLNSGNFKSTLGGNVSIVRNKVLNLFNATATIDAGFNQDYGAYNMTRTVVGEPIQSFFGWKTDGIFQNEAEVAAGPVQVPRTLSATNVPDPSTGTSPGDIRFKDISGPNGKPDGIIDSYDRTFLGSYLPKFSYGLNYTGSIRHFDFSVFFQGVYGNKIYNGTKVLTQGMLRLFNAGTDVLSAWTHEGQSTDVPRAVSGDPNQNTRTSDRFIEDGSYLRLKAVTLGFTIPASTLTHGNVNNIRIYVTGQNLITFTKYTGYDPEVGAYIPLSGNGTPGTPGNGGTTTSGLLNNGIDYGLMPSARTILAGIQLNF